MEKPDFEAIANECVLLINNGLDETGPLIKEKLEHVWNTHVVPLQEWKDRHIKILEGHGYKTEIERLESENKALREENQRLKDRIPNSSVVKN